jgi:hypothetical protein
MSQARKAAEEIASRRSFAFNCEQDRLDRVRAYTETVEAIIDKHLSPSPLIIAADQLAQAGQYLQDELDAKGPAFDPSMRKLRKEQHAAALAAYRKAREGK